MSASFLLTNPLELRVVGDGVGDGGGGGFEGGASATVAKVEASGEWRLASGENRSGSGPKPPPRRKRASGPTRSGTGGRRRLRKLTPLGPLAQGGVRRAALLLGVRESERSAASGEQGSARRRAASGRSSSTRSDILTVSDFPGCNAHPSATDVAGLENSRKRQLRAGHTAYSTPTRVE